MAFPFESDDVFTGPSITDSISSTQDVSTRQGSTQCAGSSQYNALSCAASGPSVCTAGPSRASLSLVQKASSRTQTATPLRSGYPRCHDWKINNYEPPAGTLELVMKWGLKCAPLATSEQAIDEYMAIADELRKLLAAASNGPNKHTAIQNVKSSFRLKPEVNDRFAKALKCPYTEDELLFLLTCYGLTIVLMGSSALPYRTKDGLDTKLDEVLNMQDDDPATAPASTS